MTSATAESASIFSCVRAASLCAPRIWCEAPWNKASSRIIITASAASAMTSTIPEIRRGAARLMRHLGKEPVGKSGKENREVNPQRLGQLQDFEVGNAAQLGFNLRNAFPADIPANELAFGGQPFLRNILIVPKLADIRPYDVFAVLHVPKSAQRYDVTMVCVVLESEQDESAVCEEKNDPSSRAKSRDIAHL